MENGRSLHYQGNTVDFLPAPGRRNIDKRNKGPRRQPMPGAARIPENTDEKICAALACVWCGRGFANYKIICPYCWNCQYCGLLSEHRDRCFICNNVQPPEIPVNPAEDRQRFF